MAFFSLTDIKFKSEGPRFFNRATNFEFNNKRYPIDLGTTDKAHYMMFKIFVQERTQFAKNYAEGEGRPTAQINQQSVARTNLTQSLATGIDVVGDLLNGVKTSISSVPFIGENASKALNALDPTGNQFFNSLSSAVKNGGDVIKSGSLFRTIRRTTDTIALYMPDTLNFTYNQAYSDASAKDAFGLIGQVAQAGASAVDGYKRGEALGSVENLSPFAAEVAAGLSKTGDLGFTALSALTGGVLAQNPQLELIYSRPQFRSFRFQFMFYPRDERESREVLDIIELLKFHQAPEILEGTYGRFLVPPSEFDIEFYYNGEVNKNIPTVSTCVLQSIDVDYAPNGFAAYETGNSNRPEKGGTGMPVGIRLDLGFKEVEILTKKYFAENVKNKRLPIPTVSGPISAE
jgi:hypothetical protein